MAPEQLQAMSGAHETREGVGERSDIFSLGVILYELLSGCPPFGPIAANRPWDEIRTSLLERQAQGPQNLRDANKDVDPRLAKIVESCLAFAPDQRPQCAGELADALRASRSTKERVRRWARRHSLIALGAVLCLFVIGIVTGYYLLTRDPYEIRMFNRGGRAYQSGDYAEAEECFERAADTTGSNELLADALFWRGRACLELGRGQEAVRYIGKAAELHETPETIAFHAYACARVRSFTVCVNRSRQAIKADFESAEVYNNLGFAHLQLREFDVSIEQLKRAIQLKRELIPAYYNRALAEVNLAGRQHRPVKAQAGSDIDRVIKAGSDNPYTYYDAALVYSRLDEDLYKKRILDYLCQAIRLGVDPKHLRQGFPSQMYNRDIQEELGSSVPVKERSPVDRLADPLPDQTFPFREP
jgi:tetratricopeptide (TPR) repeat protein